MIKPTSDRLDDLLRNLPVGPAPIDLLLEEALASKRRRRRTALSIAIPGLAVAIVSSILAGNTLHNSPSPTGPEDGLSEATTHDPERPFSIDLPTSDWTEGDFSFEARIHGILALDGNRCVFLDHPGAAEGTYVIWPAGYSAIIGTHGQLTLKAPDGTAIAHGGDEISAGGSYGEVGANSHVCLPRHGEVARIQSGVSSDASGSSAESTL